ncbi:MAG TPA: carboxypeptidase-like regulatory domain-containing protein [Longimicrobium sp.]|nr:carboxypeptidase-like regulatory domain-containing protein [Longimicrobium sp.]
MRIVPRNRMLRPSILLLAVCACLLPDHAAAQAARVLGRVTDGVGNPVVGATVTLVPVDSGRAPVTTATGPTGGFEFAAVPPGAYRLRAEGDGYAVREQTVMVEPGRVTSTVVRLQGSRRGRASGPAAARGRR